MEGKEMQGKTEEGEKSYRANQLGNWRNIRLASIRQAKDRNALQ